MVQAAVSTAEHNALADLYNSTNGANWTNKTNWMVAADECTWYGVSCDAGHTTVQNIDLGGNNLSGTLPASLGNLTSLENLSLCVNQLSGSVPSELGRLTGLLSINLWSNHLSGSIPPELGNLTRLQDLFLNVNQLSGDIPPQLGNLTSLRDLKLNANQLSGSIPPQLGYLIGLQTLPLGGNQLSGSIPPELGNLTRLQDLYLDNNQLSGSIPAQLGNLANLQTLYLNSNQLSGSIPAQLGNLTSLQTLILNTNQLSGSIPPELGNLTGLQLLYLSKNQLSGSIPPQLGSLTSLRDLGLNENQLTGSIPPELGRLTGLLSINLFSNQLSGSIPLELGNLTNLQSLILSVNQLSGNIPPQLEGLIGLQTLHLGGNQLTGSIPPELGSLTSLRLVNLQSNQLTGSIPPELGNLTSLQSLELLCNQLSGSIPPELGNLTSLQTLHLRCNQLSGSIPPQLGNLTNLENLYLGGNQLTGSIPPQLGNLTGLQDLELGANHLSGSIPSQLGSLTSLQSLNLGANPLSGSIPPELGSLTRLQSLDVSNNRLSGSIPPELGNLTGLRVLVVSNNQLSGSIPPELASLTSLQLLYLNSNQLSGSIPPALTNLTSLVQGDFRWNALYSTDPALTSFLTAKEGGNWQSTQTIAPANPSTSGTTPSTITVSWSPIAYTADNGFYEVSYSTTAGGPYTPFAPTTSSKSDSSLTVTGLTTNTTYYLVVSTTTQPHSNNSNTVTSGFSTEVSGTAAASSPSVNAFTANPSTIIEGQSSTLSWATTNATAVSISGVVETQPANGSRSVSPAVTTTYTLTATGSAGTATATTTVTVNPAVPPDIVSFSASPSTITAGQTSTLSWTTTNATSVSLGGFGAQPLNGSITVSPTTSTTYALTAEAPGGSATAGMTVKVLGPFSRLQLLLPGEIAVPGSPTGKAGAPAAQVAGTPFPVVVNGVDASFNVVTTATDTVGLTGSDPGATLPPSAPLVAGTRSFTVTLAASAGQTITASDLSDSNKGPSTSPSIAVIALNDPAVAVASFPAGLVAAAGTAGATDSYALINTGGAQTQITLSQSGNFFTQSPASFTLERGATQVITLTSFAQPAGVYEGASTPRGAGVPTGMTVPVRLLSAIPVAGSVGATPTASRTEVSAPVGTNPTGTVAFTNSGSATLLGILISDSPWLIPDSAVITIPPGETVTVSFTIDRSKQPNGGTVGSTIGTLSLVFVAPTGAGALWAHVAPYDSTPQTGQVSVSIVDVAKPPVALGPIPPLGLTEVALLVSGLRHGNGVKADLAIVNTGLPASLNDLQLYYVSPSSASQASPIGQLLPNISVSLADVVKSVFGHDGETGGVLLRSTNIDRVSVSAMRLNTSSPRGTYASSLPVFRSDRSMAAGNTVFLAGLKKENGFHTNVFLQEAAGMAGAVKIDFLDAHGTPIGTRAPDALSPFGFLEIADAAPAGAAAARITSLGPSQSRIVAYGLAIDEVTGDSWGLVDWSALYAAQATEPSVLPLAGGGAGARAQTDLALMNKTPAVNLVTLKYTTGGSSRRHAARPSGFSTGPSATPEALIEQTQIIALDPLSSTTISDLLSTRFGVPSDSIGYLTITPAAGVAITARTYRSSAQPGTAGTGVAAVPVSSTLTAGQAKYFAGIEDASPASITASAPATYRTNLGLIETAGQPVSVRVTMRYSFPAGMLLSGHAESAQDFVLSPGQFLLVTDAAATIIGGARSSFGDLHNVQIEIRVTDGNGRVLPFLQSIDNGTGDVILRTD